MQDLYKQAIADAKALRASAIANAKASLQETFAPQVEALVKQSLREEAEDEAEEKQVKKESKNGAYTKNVKVKASIKEEELEEAEDLEESEEDEDLEESTLEEILGELEELEEDEDMEEGEDMEETYDNMEEDEDMEEAEDMEDGEHEEPDADNIGGPSDHDADNAEEGEDDEEIVLTFGQLKQALAPFIGGEEGMEPGTDDTDAEEADIDLDEILGEDDLEEPEDLEEDEDLEESTHKMEEKKHAKEMDEAKKAIEEMRHSLQEVNLLNAKLLYMNKIFKAKSLNEAQKKRVVGAFDRASNVKEVKNIFATLNESITAPKKQLSESFSYASKPMGYAPKQNITEADPFISRMQKLAGIIK